MGFRLFPRKLDGLVYEAQLMDGGEERVTRKKFRRNRCSGSG